VRPGRGACPRAGGLLPCDHRLEDRSRPLLAGAEKVRSGGPSRQCAV